MRSRVPVARVAGEHRVEQVRLPRQRVAEEGGGQLAGHLAVAAEVIRDVRLVCRGLPRLHQAPAALALRSRSANMRLRTFAPSLCGRACGTCVWGRLARQAEQLVERANLGGRLLEHGHGGVRALHDGMPPVLSLDGLVADGVEHLHGFALRHRVLRGLGHGVPVAQKRDVRHILVREAPRCGDARPDLRLIVVRCDRFRHLEHPGLLSRARIVRCG